MSEFIKDPQATLDYAWDWSAWLAPGENIVTATVTAGAGIEVAPAGLPTTNTANSVTAWLAGGTAGATYPVTCYVQTNAGRKEERTLYVRVMER